jgi:hypothetical protein
MSVVGQSRHRKRKLAGAPLASAVLCAGLLIMTRVELRPHPSRLALKRVKNRSLGGDPLLVHDQGGATAKAILLDTQASLL